MVDYSKQDSVAIVAVDNPPVNILSHHVRVRLFESFERAARDEEVAAVVLCGKGRTFPAGGDVKELSQELKDPWIDEIGLRIESMKKPVVAAIHGACLGGGLELALYCHYRIAMEKARVGFPEVHIGISPGGGGTQLLPRVAGLQVAMEMITTGRQVPAKEAERYNIIDKVVTGDIVNEGIKFALKNTRKSLSTRRLTNRVPHKKDRLGEILNVALLKIRKPSSGMLAPVWNIMSVMNSVVLPFKDGLAAEKMMLFELLASDQAKALQYVSFAERTIKKWQLPSGGNSETAVPQKINSVSVIGAGTMGAGITVSLLSAGIHVLLVEENEEFLLKGLSCVRSILEGGVERGKATEEQVMLTLSQLTTSVNLDDLHSVDLVIEAVCEDLALKLEIFAKLSHICKSDAILCSNTSFLDIDKIAASTCRPEKVVGTHFFFPAHIKRLLENIYGSRTSPETVATVMALGKKIGKVPILVRTGHGFCANRLMTRQTEEAILLVEEGASPQQIDQVLEDFGMSLGIFKVRNLEGSGWYYSGKPASKDPFIDDDVTELITKPRENAGITPSQITPQEIQERILYATMNEGFKILEDGTAARPEDIDIVSLYGLGFPRHYGGPMFHANEIGLKTVYDRIYYYHKRFSYSIQWRPSKLLEKLAADHVPIGQWVKAMQSRL